MNVQPAGNSGTPESATNDAADNGQSTGSETETNDDEAEAEDAPDTGESDDDQGDETDGEEGEEGDEGETQEADDSEEMEDDEGKKHKVPKALAKALKDRTMMRTDYSKKTAALAETSRQLTAAIQQVKTVNEEVTKGKAQLYAYDSAIAKLETKGLANLDDQEFRQLQMLKLEREGIETGVKAKETEQGQAVARARDKQRSDAEAYVSEQIPEFNEDLARQVAKFAADNVGLKEADFFEAAIDNPRVFTFVHRALKAFGELETLKAAAAKTAKTQKRVEQIQTAQRIRPAAEVKGGGIPQSSKSLADANYEQYVALRSKKRG